MPARLDEPARSPWVHQVAASQDPTGSIFHPTRKARMFYLRYIAAELRLNPVEVTLALEILSQPSIVRLDQPATGQSGEKIQHQLADSTGAFAGTPQIWKVSWVGSTAPFLMRTPRNWLAFARSTGWQNKPGCGMA